MKQQLVSSVNSLQPKLRPVIGSKFAPGTVFRNTFEGSYYETMPEDLGSEGERIQSILLTKQRQRVYWWKRLFGVAHE